MADPFESSRLKIARAKQHVKDLETGIQSFIGSEPYECVSEADPNDADRFHHKINLVKPLPKGLAVFAGEASNCLREALDNSGYALAAATGKPDSRSCAFPFSGSSADFERSARGRCKDLRDGIFALLRRFKPYKGGNDLLWALNGICNVNKHRMLVPVVIRLERMTQIHATVEVG
jgi:hypothetical protein